MTLLSPSPYTNMISSLKEFGFKELSLLDQQTIFKMLEEHETKEVQKALHITLWKFSNRPSTPKSFIRYWETVVNN